MEPRDTAEPADLNQLRIDLLRSAVDIYIRIAYSDNLPPDTVKRRMQWPLGVSASELLSAPPFERAGKNKSNGSLIYALRLGNSQYPHMKLQIQPWPNSSGFMLSVNTHDQVLAVERESALQGDHRAGLGRLGPADVSPLPSRLHRMQVRG